MSRRLYEATSWGGVALLTLQHLSRTMKALAEAEPGPSGWGWLSTSA